MYHATLDQISDFLLGSAYISIAVTLAHFIRKRSGMPFRFTAWAFATCLFLCGVIHLSEIVIEASPWLKALAALTSVCAFLGMLSVLSRVLAMRSPIDLEQEVGLRTVEIERVNQRYRYLIDLITDVLWLADANGNFIAPQEAWERYTGQKWEEHRGHGWLNAIHAEDRDRIEAIWTCATKSLTPYSACGRIWHHNSQSYRHFESKAVPLFDDTGELIEWVGAMTDVSERVLAKERMQAEAKAKDNFLAMLAHELRNPLSPILNCVTILRQDQDPETIAWAQDTITRQTTHMARLVEDLLDVSRIMRGKIVLKGDITDLTATMFGAVETVKPLIESFQHNLILVPPTASITFIADGVRLAQIISNLLSNAAKYTPPGGTIWLTGGIEDGKVVVRVKDNGLGIEEEYLDKIFDPFFQVDCSLDRTKGGLGIGLALVKSIVDMHHGTIKVSSRPHEGSVFTVTIPLKWVTPMSEDKQPKPPEEVYRILVVDDNVDAARSLAIMLRYEGHKTQFVFNGPAALAICEDFRPDIVILDIGLPGMSGYDVCVQMRQMESCRSARIIAMTGYNTEDHRRRSKEAGMDEHLVKPVSVEALKDSLKK